MHFDDLRTAATSFLAEAGAGDGLQACGVRSMGVLQTRHAKTISCSVVEPVIGLILQGGKSVQYGTEAIRYEAGDLVVIGQALPMISGRVDARPDHPYIALYVGIDMQVLRSVYSDMGGSTDDEVGPALETGRADPETVASLAHMFGLRRDPIEERTLGQGALREVYFRVLRSAQGRVLQRVIRADSKANQIAKAIAHIRSEYRTQIKASDLAALSGMSASVFYDAFKRVTANSPLQFQKDLRLTEAHNILQQTKTPVSEVAHSVGYESAAQFSREFSKKFGTPPRDLVRSLGA